MLVIACNTASAAMLRDARERYDVPVVEVIQPAVRRAVGATRNGHVGVIGTRATITSMAYDDAFAAAPHLKLTTAACPRFVEFAEQGITMGPELIEVAHEYLDPLVEAGVDTLVLGCTHYPLLIGAISYVVGEDVVLVSSADETALDVYRILVRDGLSRTGRPPRARAPFPGDRRLARRSPPSAAGSSGLRSAPSKRWPTASLRAAGRVLRMPRLDGRANDALRPVTITRNWLDHAEGSVLVEFGRDPRAGRRQRHRGRAALAQGQRPGLGDRRVRDAAARDQHPQRPRVGQGSTRRPHPGDLPAGRPRAALVRRLQAARREHDRARLRRARGRRRHPHRGDHRRVRRARRRRELAAGAGLAQGRAAGAFGRRGVRRRHRRRAAPRPLLRGRRARRDRHERGHHRRRRLRRGAGHRRG